MLSALVSLSHKCASWSGTVIWQMFRNLHHGKMTTELSEPQKRANQQNFKIELLHFRNLIHSANVPIKVRPCLTFEPLTG